MGEVTDAMNRTRVAVMALAIAVSTTAGVAQSPKSRSMPLAPGDQFPELDVYDAAGKPFNTKSLKGNHAVIVNGCLT